MTISNALAWGVDRLERASVRSARLDAEILLAFVLKRPAVFLLTHEKSPMGLWQYWRYHRLIHRRAKHVPVAYLTGHKEFFMLDFYVNKHVLIPRPDTEILVEAVLDYIGNHSVSTLVDAGTGSGAIAIAALKNRPDLKAVGIDVSSKALKVARLNATRHGVLGRLRLVRSDLLLECPPPEAPWVLVANLPYIPMDFPRYPESDYEPSLALFGGLDGLDIYRRMAGQLKAPLPEAIFVEAFAAQISVLKTFFPGYSLIKTLPMTGQAQGLVFVREK